METGSLVTAPGPYRTVDLDVAKRAFTLTTSTVQATTTRPADFKTFSSGYLMTGLTTITNATLTQAYKLDTATAAQLTPLIVSAMMAHYQGDENIDALPEPIRCTAKGTIAALRQSPDPNQGPGRLHPVPVVGPRPHGQQPGYLPEIVPEPNPRGCWLLDLSQAAQPSFAQPLKSNPIF